MRANLSPEAYSELVSFNSYARSFGNILTLGTLHITPATPATRAFLRHAQRAHPLLNNLTVHVHATEAHALRYVMDHEHDERTWAVLVFYSLPSTAMVDPAPRSTASEDVDDDATATPASSAATASSGLRYAIRLNYSTVPNTNFLHDWIARGLDTRYQRYILSGFLTLQALVDEFGFASVGNVTSGPQDVRRTPGGLSAPAAHAVATPFPTPAYSQNAFYQAVAFMLGLVMTMCFLLPVRQEGTRTGEESAPRRPCDGSVEGDGSVEALRRPARARPA